MNAATEAALQARTCEVIIQLGALLESVKLAREVNRLRGDTPEADALITLQQIEEAECAGDTAQQLLADLMLQLMFESEAARVAAGSLAGGAS
jgi:hypothetical protein